MPQTPDEAAAEKLRYEKIAQYTKWHHFVPQFYLRHFKAAVGGDRLYMYRAGSKPALVPVRDIAASKNLYTFETNDGSGKTRVFEGIFSEHEGMVAPVLDNIIASQALPSDEQDRSHLAAFVSLLHVRGPSFTDWLKNMEIEHLKLLQRVKAEEQPPESLRKEFEEAGITFTSDEEFEEMREFMRDPSRYTVEMRGGEGHYFKQAMELSKDLYAILMTKKSWHLLCAPAARHFVTSDNPVVIHEPHDCPPEVAGGFAYGTVLLTISPQLCLAFRTVPLITEKVDLNRQDVDHINRSIASAARRQVYGHLESRDIAKMCDEQLIGDESRVAIRRLAKYAPYYMVTGRPRLKEAEGIRVLSKSHRL